MRFLVKVLAFTVVLIALLGVVGMFLPRHITVERSTIIDAPASDIYPHLANLQATAAWSPWLALDPDTQLTFNDIAQGVGATMAWASDHAEVGTGEMEITAEEQDKHLTIQLDFGEMGQGQATWDLTQTGDVTTATWGMSTDMGAGPMGRWIGLAMDGMIGPQYEQGLANLKALVEAGG